VVNIFPRLSVFENVQIAVLSRERKTFRIFSPVAGMAEEEVHRILRSVGLFDQRDVESDLLSHGDKKVLEIAVALSGNPELLILDEPTAGMAPEETERCIRLIRKLSGESGLTILFCEIAVALSGNPERLILDRRGYIITFALTRSRCARDLNTIHENTTVSPRLTLILRGNGTIPFTSRSSPAHSRTSRAPCSRQIFPAFRAMRP
jgi:branched-chain amino acid transport system ATP-binding protein